MDTLRNNFHNTEIRVRDSARTIALLDAVYSTLTESEKRHVQRVRAALCGAADCTCGVVRDSD